MAKDFRATDAKGDPIPFSCENRSYATNRKRGYPHGPDSKARGSVLETPLVESRGYSLWLEHVIEKDTENEVYWLMWYGPDCVPTIPLSAIFSKTDLAKMVERLASAGLDRP